MRIGIDARPLSTRLTGIGRYLLNTLKQLEKLDNENEYYLYSNRDFAVQFDAKRWHKRVGAGCRAKVGSVYILGLGRCLTKDHIDLFWGTQSILPLSSKIPFIVTVPDLCAYLFPKTMRVWNLAIHRLFMRRSIKAAKRIIVISDSTGKGLRDVFGVKADKIARTHLAAGDEFKVGNREESAKYIAEKYDTSEGYILTVGTVEPRKNIAALLRAFKVFAERSGGRFQLLVVGGKGWKDSSIFGVYRDLGLTEAEVKFAGYVPEEDMPNFYRGAKAFIFPSFYEGFGLPLVEAMACGCPVIASHCSSMPEVCGEAAMYIDPTSVESIACGIWQVISDERLRDSLIAKGFEQAGRYSWERTAVETLKAIERVAG